MVLCERVVSRTGLTCVENAVDPRRCRASRRLATGEPRSEIAIACSRRRHVYSRPRTSRKVTEAAAASRGSCAFLPDSQYGALAGKSRRMAERSSSDSKPPVNDRLLQAVGSLIVATPDDAPPLNRWAGWFSQNASEPIAIATSPAAKEIVSPLHLGSRMVSADTTALTFEARVAMRCMG